MEFSSPWLATAPNAEQLRGNCLTGLPTVARLLAAMVAGLVAVPQFATTTPRHTTCHRLLSPELRSLAAAWESGTDGTILTQGRLWRAAADREPSRSATTTRRPRGPRRSWRSRRGCLPRGCFALKETSTESRIALTCDSQEAADSRKPAVGVAWGTRFTGHRF